MTKNVRRLLLISLETAQENNLTIKGFIINARHVRTKSCSSGEVQKQPCN